MSNSPVTTRLRLTAAQNGLDPLTHYWFKVGEGEYRRICDSVAWRPGIRFRFPPREECEECRALHYTDRVAGQQVFSLTYKLPGGLAPKQNDHLHQPADGQELRIAMPSLISIKTFTNFCLASPRDRDRMRRPRGDFAPYYASLLKELRVRHWATEDIERLNGVEFNLLRTSKGFESKNADLHEVLQHYINFWTTQKGEVFEVPKLCTRISTDIGDLHVKVDPEIGMRNAAGEQALKLRFDQPEITRRFLEIFHYLLEKATTEPSWPSTQSCLESKG